MVLALLAVGLAPAIAQAEAQTSYPLSRFVATKGGNFETEGPDFAWALTARPGLLGPPITRRHVLLAAQTHHCRAVSLTIAAGLSSAYLAVHQRGRRAVTGTATAGRTGQLDARLTPGRPFELVAATPGISAAIFVNGSLSCSDASGRWSQPHLTSGR